MKMVSSGEVKSQVAINVCVVRRRDVVPSNIVLEHDSQLTFQLDE